MMTFKNIQIPFASLFLLALFSSSCGKDEKLPPVVTYPIVYAYDHLAFPPILWYVLTTNSYTQIATPTIALGLDDELQTVFHEDLEPPPFDKLEFLSASTVRMTIVDSGFSFDTILPYYIEAGKTKVQFDLALEGLIIFNAGAAPNTLEFGVVSTIYTYVNPNGTVDYSALESQYSDELDVSTILNALRADRNLMAGDTVGVHRAAFVYK